jgi:hypothetical protein
MQPKIELVAIGYEISGKPNKIMQHIAQQSENSSKTDSTTAVFRRSYPFALVGIF